MASKINPRMLLIFIGVLLLTNIAMLLYFTGSFRKKESPKSPASRMGELLKNEVGFDDQQLARYLELRTMRDSLMAGPNRELRQSRRNMISLLQGGDTSDSTVTAAAQDIGHKQAEIEKQYFRHFQRIKNICNAEQSVKFDSLLLRMANRSGTDEGRRNNGQNKGRAASKTH